MRNTTLAKASFVLRLVNQERAHAQSLGRRLRLFRSKRHSKKKQVKVEVAADVVASLFTFK